MEGLGHYPSGPVNFELQSGDTIRDDKEMTITTFAKKAVVSSRSLRYLTFKYLLPRTIP